MWKWCGEIGTEEFSVELWKMWEERREPFQSWFCSRYEKFYLQWWLSEIGNFFNFSYCFIIWFYYYLIVSCNGYGHVYASNLDKEPYSKMKLSKTWWEQNYIDSCYKLQQTKSLFSDRRLSNLANLFWFYRCNV